MYAFLYNRYVHYYLHFNYVAFLGQGERKDFGGLLGLSDTCFNLNPITKLLLKYVVSDFKSKCKIILSV